MTKTQRKKPVLSSVDRTEVKWPATNIQLRPIGSLSPYEKNARTHSPAQIEQIVASIREWGWTNPILADESGTILAGHGRVLAAKQLGIEKVPVIVAGGWSEAQKRAYILADNQLALNAGWDLSILQGEVRGLNEWGFDLNLLGFDNLDELMAETTEGLTDPDAAPPLPQRPVTRQGDVWLLGRHRLACGDSTNRDCVEIALGGAKPHLMVTDPPYGVNYDPAWRLRLGLNSPRAAFGTVPNDDRADWSEAWALFPGTVAYVWHGGLHSREVWESLERCNFAVRAQIIWSKTRPAISRGNYHWQHEPCFYAVKNGSTASWRGGRKQTTVWSIEHLKSDTGHSAQKPVECMRRPIENNSRPKETIYDPFVGSGTTLVAAEMTGRCGIALDISPGYCDVTLRRWEAFTGEEAVLEASGQTFAEVGSERVGEKEAELAAVV